MESIRQWAFSVCAAMVASGLSQMLLPKAGMEKIFRVTVNVFFLCCLLSPILLQMPSLRIEVEEYAQSDIEARARRLEQAVASQTDDAAKWELEKLIGKKLGQMGINYHDITININNNGQSGPRIETVEIVIDRTHERQHTAINSALSSEFGFDFRLGYAGWEED